MAKLQLQTKNQIISKMVAELLAKTSINDVNPGSVVLTLLELAATEDFNQYAQMLNIVRNYNLDTTTGQDLDKRAFEYGLERRAAQFATGVVTIQREASFQKVSSGIYTGLPAPLETNTVLRVNDASNPLYGTSGTLIVGRGTPNEEEVTYVAAPTNFVNYWEFVISPLSNDHNSDETVILKQGNDETIQAGTILRVPGSSNSPEINFATVQDVILLAGEAEITGVDVRATVRGSVGNIPVNAINGEDAFTSAPFIGARAVNEAKFTTGRDRETDEQLRDRIKTHIQSLSRGTATAVESAIVGAQDENTAKRVVSANIIEPTTRFDPVKIYIDDGTGFEPSFEQRGFETLLTNSSGGEERLQLDFFPLVKAQAETFNAEPFNMSSGALTLTYEVGLASETIQFVPQDFQFPGSVTAEEIVRVINDRTTLLEARTSQDGKQIVISARADENEDLQVTGGTANPILLFPTDRRSTLFLYANDELLSKDGETAFLDSDEGNFDFTTLGPAPWTLNLIVDGKASNPASVDLVSADFVDDTSATPEEVATAINARLPGATATTVANGTRVRISSNTENSAASSLEVTGGSANTVLAFSTSPVFGKTKDYTLNVELGQIEFDSPLGENILITAGTRFSRAKLITGAAEFYTIAPGQTLVLVVDSGPTQTVTFAVGGVLSAQQVADIINSQTSGLNAISRQIGTDNFLQVQTNTYAESSGSIEVLSSSTATALNFPLDQEETNSRPNKASRVSNASSPWNFVDGDNLIVVLDDDPASRTFNLIFSFDGEVTSAASDTVFNDSGFNTIFTTEDVLEDFYLIFRDGANTTSGTVTTITNQGGNTWRYAFGSLPANMADFAIGDHVSLTGSNDVENDGNFIITGISAVGDGFIEISNIDGIADPIATTAVLIGQRRQITAYNEISGEITVDSSFRATPTIGNEFFIAPSSVDNVVSFLNNNSVTSINRRAFIEGAEANSVLQISSRQDGSDGFVQITGGSANALFGFSTTQTQGLQAYNHYTGLLKYVHRILYGDEQDLVSFPGVLAAGVKAQILAPTVTEVRVTVTLTLAEGVSISNVDQEVRSRITGYINNLGIGRNVIKAELCNRIVGVDGVTDVEIVLPNENIVIAENELARTRIGLITIG